MNDYDRGDVVRVDVEFKDIDAVLTSPTTVVLTVRAPDGTLSTPAVTPNGTGKYYADVTVSQSGIYHYRWVGTGGAGAGASTGQLRVRKDVFV